VTIVPIEEVGPDDDEEPIDGDYLIEKGLVEERGLYCGLCMEEIEEIGRTFRLEDWLAISGYSSAPKNALEGALERPGGRFRGSRGV